MQLGNDGHWCIDGRSTLLRSLAATDLVTVIFVIVDPIAFIELAIVAMQSGIIIMPELLPSLFFFAAVVAHFIRAAPERL